MNNFNKPTCPVCNSHFTGKQNKIFCSIECKNRHHYVAKLQSTTIQTKKNNKFIKRNYVVLLGIFRGNNKEIIIHRNVLFEHGFIEFEYLNKKIVGKEVTYIIKEFKFVILKNGFLKIKRTHGINTFYAEFIDRWKISFPDGFDLKLKRYSDGIIRYFQSFGLLSLRNSTVKSFNNGERIIFLE